MSRLKTIIGVLILFTYLCPFASCERPFSQTAIPAGDSTTIRAISDSILKVNSGITRPKLDTSALADSTAISDSTLNADSSNINRLKMDSSAAGDTFSNTDTTNSTLLENDTETQDEKNKFWGRLFFPTDDSLSGLFLVCTFDANEQAFLLVSFLLSIVIVLPFKTQYKTGRILIVGVNLACIIAFMYLAAVVDGERLLWGVWLLLLLVSVHLFLEIRDKKVAPITDKEPGK